MYKVQILPKAEEDICTKKHYRANLWMIRTKMFVECWGYSRCKNDKN